MTSYSVVLALFFGAWENVSRAGFMATMNLPVRDVNTGALRSHAQCCVSKGMGVSVWLSITFYFHFKVWRICFSVPVISLIC